MSGTSVLTQLAWSFAVALAALVIMLPAAGGETLEQETISIEGNRGLPKTLYIAPWKRVGEPLEGERFTPGMGREAEPLERDSLQRELELHRQGYSLE